MNRSSDQGVKCKSRMIGGYFLINSTLIRFGAVICVSDNSLELILSLGVPGSDTQHIANAIPIPGEHLALDNTGFVVVCFPRVHATNTTRSDDGEVKIIV